MAEAQKKEQAFAETEAPRGEAPAGMAEDPAAYDATEAQAHPGDLEAELAALRAERDDLRDRVMRALADAENSRKRAERDRREGLMYGGAKLARDMLPVYDHLSRALEAAGDEVKTNGAGLYEGIDLTLRELVNVLARHGVERIVPKPGDIFDPHQHQAMFEAPLPGFAAGQIIQVMAVGFRMHDQLLRPAQVGVSSTPG
jgi:molecular chaperone GrpE